MQREIDQVLAHVGAIGDAAENSGVMLIAIAAAVRDIEGQQHQDVWINGGVYGPEHASPTMALGWLIARFAKLNNVSVRSLIEKIELEAVDHFGNIP